MLNFHHATLHALAELIAAAGLDHPQDVRAMHFSHRSAENNVVSFTRLYPQLQVGELITGSNDKRFREAWVMAQAESFQPVDARASA